MNIWEGTVAGPDRVACGIGTVQVADPLPGPGAKVAVAVRPEQIALADQASGVNQVTGIVADVVYGGTVSTYFIQCGDQRVRAVRQNGAGASLERGTGVIASWPAGAVRVLAP